MRKLSIFCSAIVLAMSFDFAVWAGGAEPAAPKPATDLAAQERPAAPADAIPSQEELERKFAETLSGSQLVGVFTVTGQESDKPPAPDKYTIERVKKLKGDYWL